MSTRSFITSQILISSVAMKEFTVIDNAAGKKHRRKEAG